MLSQQGESLLSLAQELGMRIFNRHVVQRKQLNDEVQALQERYFKYLHLLASDTQVRSGGGWNEELLLGLGFGGSSGVGSLVGFQVGKLRSPYSPPSHPGAVGYAPSSCHFLVAPTLFPHLNFAPVGVAGCELSAQSPGP